MEPHAPMTTRASLFDLKMAAGMIAVVAIAAGLWQGRTSDVEACRQAFRGLAAGAPSAQGRLDWERLTALGVDVGATYRGLPSDQERRRYREAFVANFSKGFQQTGATAEQFVRWRVEERTPETVTVAADYPAKQQTLRLGVSARGKKRVQAIAWK